MSIWCSTLSQMRHMASKAQKAATAKAFVPLAPHNGAAAPRRQMAPHRTTQRPLQAKPEAAKAAAAVAQGVYEVRRAQGAASQTPGLRHQEPRLLRHAMPACCLPFSHPRPPPATLQASGVPLVDAMMQMATVEAALPSKRVSPKP